MVRRARRTFSEEFKADTVRLILEGGKSAYAVARDLDLTASAVRSWVQQARVDRGQGPAGALSSEERAELTRLRRENRQLKMEREILKKAAAFFAKEST